MPTNNTKTNNNDNTPKTQPVKLKPQNINKTTKTDLNSSSKKSPKKDNAKLIPRNVNTNTKEICKRISLSAAFFR